MSDYPHTLRITRGSTDPGAGGQDVDGVWTPDPGQPQEVVLYDGPADVQDGGDTVERDNAGSPTAISNAVAFLADESQLSLILPNDAAKVTWADGSVTQAAVNKVRKLDGTIFLKRL
jgi:hypothetical protein